MLSLYLLGTLFASVLYLLLGSSLMKQINSKQGFLKCFLCVDHLAILQHLH